MLFTEEIIAVCSEIHIKHISTLCGQNVEFFNAKLAVRIVTTGVYNVKLLAPELFFLILAHPVYKM